jgi:hypothetical protein
LSCENVAGFTNIPISSLLSSEERDLRLQLLDQFTYGGCGNDYSTGFDGPIEVAACVDKRCATRESSWCGQAPEPSDAGVESEVTGDSLDASMGDASLGDASLDAAR